MNLIFFKPLQREISSRERYWLYGIAGILSKLCALMPERVIQKLIRCGGGLEPVESGYAIVDFYYRIDAYSVDQLRKCEFCFKHDGVFSVTFLVRDSITESFKIHTHDNPRIGKPNLVFKQWKKSVKKAKNHIEYGIVSL